MEKKFDDMYLMIEAEPNDSIAGLDIRVFYWAKFGMPIFLGSFAGSLDIEENQEYAKSRFKEKYEQLEKLAGGMW